MLSLEIMGGSRMEQTLTAEAVTFAFNELIPRIKNCTLNVYLVSSDSCFETDDREYEIRINKNQTGDDFLTAIFHEMVHVKQYIRGQLDQDSNLDYFDRPSEIEAYKLQEELLEKWKSK